MFACTLALPGGAFFLLGPRGTGKRTWIRTHLADALVVNLLQPETARGYFDWFDPGVLHAAAGGFDQPLPADFAGVLLEHLVLHELKAYLHYHDVKGSLGYWATPSGGEVDFVFWRGTSMVAIEVKAARRFRPENRGGMFFRRLHAGEILG